VILIRPIAFLLALLPAAASAQSGVILFDRAVRYDLDVPEGPGGMPPGGMRPREMPPEGMRPGQMRNQIPSADISQVLLLFNESASLLVPAPPAEEEQQSDPEPRERRMMLPRFRMGSPLRSAQETHLEAFVNFADDSIVETREFMGRVFLIRGARPSYAWRLSGEMSQFLGYTVQKATAVQDSSMIEAWFTPEIPVSAGPGLFGGLPGMILSISVDSGQTVYSATEVDLTTVEDGAIKAPDNGQEVSRDEYEQIVTEKLEELEMQRRGRRRRP
jgi:GLPGLI family protein